MLQKIWPFSRNLSVLKAPTGLALALIFVWAAFCCAPIQKALAHEVPTQTLSCHENTADHSAVQVLSQASSHQDCPCFHPHKQSPGTEVQNLLGSVQALSIQWTHLPVFADSHFRASQDALIPSVQVPRPPPLASKVWHLLAAPPVFYTSTLLLI